MIISIYYLIFSNSIFFVISYGYNRWKAENYNFDPFRAILVHWSDSTSRTGQFLQQLDPPIHGHLISDYIFNFPLEVRLCIKLYFYYSIWQYLVCLAR